MKTQITFKSRYEGYCDKEALAWLKNLAECFNIRKASVATYQWKSKYCSEYRCKVLVQYD